MRRIATGLATVLLAVSLGACFQHTYTVGAGAPDGEIVYKNWHHHWLFGTIRPKLQRELAIDKFCPSGNATIHEEVSFLNGLIDVLIGVIYSPTTVEIRCDTGERASLDLTSEEVTAIVTDPLFLEVVEELVPERLAETRLALRGVEGADEAVRAAR